MLSFLLAVFCIYLIFRVVRIEKAYEELLSCTNDLLKSVEVLADSVKKEIKKQMISANEEDV